MNLTQKLLEKTREGRLADWGERIGCIAERAGIELSLINWNASPQIVCWEIVEHCKIRGMTDSLERALNE